MTQRDKGQLLSHPMRDLLWTVAQHKYGWAHCPNAGRDRRLQVAEALERRGLVSIDRSKPHMPTCSATGAGRAEIARRWPVSPFALGTYEHQPGGWTPVEGVAFGSRTIQKPDSLQEGCNE